MAEVFWFLNFAATEYKHDKLGESYNTQDYVRRRDSWPFRITSALIRVLEKNLINGNGKKSLDCRPSLRLRTGMDPQRGKVTVSLSFQTARTQRVSLPDKDWQAGEISFILGKTQHLLPFKPLIYCTRPLCCCAVLPGPIWISPKIILAEIHRIMFDWILGCTVTQSNWHINVALIIVLFWTYTSLPPYTYSIINNLQTGTTKISYSWHRLQLSSV